MSNLFNNKFTLDDFFDNEKSILPQIKTEKNKLRTTERKQYASQLRKEKGEFNLNESIVVDIVSQIAMGGASKHYKDAIMNMAGATININGELKHTHKLDMVVEDIYQALITNKGLIKQMIQNYNMLRDAIEFSNKMYKKPHLYLTLNSKSQLKDLTFLYSKSAARTKFMTEVMQNIYFNDSFKPIQEKYGVINEKMVRNNNTLRNYEYEKERWKKRVGYGTKN